MTNFESILNHLGPSAKPLMDFMNNVMARNLSQTNKCVRTFILNHKMRWGFPLAPYSANPDGSFVLKTSTSTYKSKSLTKNQTLVFTRNMAPHYSMSHAVWLVNGNGLTVRLIGGTREDIDAIKKMYLKN